MDFGTRLKNEVHAERAPNARYQFSDAVEMIVTGLMTGAAAMEYIVTVWSDEALLRMRGACLQHLALDGFADGRPYAALGDKDHTPMVDPGGRQTDGRPSPTRFEIAEDLSSSRRVERMGADVGNRILLTRTKRRG